MISKHLFERYKLYRSCRRKSADEQPCEKKPPRSNERGYTIFVVALVLGLGSMVVPAAGEPWSFREGRGIALNDRASAAIGLAVAEVEAKPELAMDSAITEPVLLETVRGDFVYVKNGNAFLRVPVKTGKRTGGYIEILDGLFEGDEVVSAGAYDLWMIELQAINGGRGCADGH